MKQKAWKDVMYKIGRNWYFPISMLAFWWLGATVDLKYFLLAIPVSLAAAYYVPTLRECLRMGGLWVQIVSVMSSMGVCWGAYSGWNTAGKEGEMQKLLPVSPRLLDLFSIGCMGLALLCVYVCLVWFWTRMLQIFKEQGTFRNIRIREILIWVIVFVIVLAVVASVFLKTDMVYGTEYNFDNIYTSDSAALVKENVYLTLNHAENDIRQPLFAVFAAPFMGLPNLIVELLSVSAPVRAVIYNAAQLMLLFVTLFLMAKMMGLSEGKRICFLLFVCSSYTCLLFEVMMEQYIVACFWMVFFLYQAAENRQPSRLALWGAGGTLLTSMILLPLMSKKNPLKDFKGWFLDMFRYGMGFVGMILLCCRYDVLFQLVQQTAGISGYAGGGLTFLDKLCQYTYFVRSCFAAPAAGVDFAMTDHVSWKMAEVTGISIAGVLLFVLAVVSAVLNRNKRSSRLAAGWMAFSVVMLLVAGWGTAENGLVLYALYFGWSFFVLLFQLVEWVAEKTGAAWLVPVVSLCAGAALLMVNIPAMAEMVSFGIAYYPI